MQKAFETIKQLVADFKAQETAYLSPSYQESQIRQDFIDKFFTALGWDVTHTVQKNPYQQEVHIENKVHMAGSQRRADYAFFLAPNFRDPKFFVEAKKPSRNLGNPDDYYQTIRYGWNANTPIAILTDFEEFHILDCRYKPNIKDVMNQKIEYFHYSDYANEEKFSRIYWLFSHEAVAGGSLEKRVAELPKPRGKGVSRFGTLTKLKPVDEAFLEELDTYREILAKAFKKSNPDLQSEELTEAVQRTIDRLVFIRFLEDKQIEEPEIINLRSKKSAWDGFLWLSKKFDPKYNGLVFKPHKILDGKDFNPPDDEEFVRICNELADPGSPYNFDQIPISILGSIYERFLGKVVHATDKRVKVEEKPEVRKAGGVYYTPEYIVRYIVHETVCKLLYGETEQPTEGQSESKRPSEGNLWKTPEEVAQMAFADIACGSGSFLIEVYNQLLEYHIRYYVEHPEKQKEADVFERDGKLKLTLKKKKEILLNNIYGVDIDFQATEVTQLSLFLKMLEDVTMQDAHQFGMFKETILPDLRQNIVCGNSLIGTDIYDGDLFAPVAQSFPRTRESHIEEGKIPAYAGMTGEKEIDGGVDKLKPMNFEDVFPKVIKRGGFDAVVGNPPYGRDILTNLKSYFESEYDTCEYKLDSFVFFIEKAVNLLSVKGKMGYIIPNTWLDTETFLKLRTLLLTRSKIETIVNLGKDVFGGANIDTLILVASIQSPAIIRVIDASDHLSGDRRLEKTKRTFEIEQLKLLADPIKKINIHTNSIERKVFEKIKINSINIGNITEISQGLIPYNTKEMSEKNEYISNRPKGKEWKKLLDRGNCISRYSLSWNHQYIRFGPWLYTANQPKFYENRKILVQRHRNPSLKVRVVATIDDNLYYFKDNLCGIISKANNDYDLAYLLGLINSSLMNEYYRKNHTEVSLNPIYLRELPIHTINFDDPQDKSRHDAIVKLVEQMLEAKEKLSNAKTDGETNRLEMQCESLDRQIDEHVYELYGLTEEEIKIVEGKT